jgi:hypothetical protein
MAAYEEITAPLIEWCCDGARDGALLARARERLAAFKGAPAETAQLTAAVETIARAAAEPEDTPPSRARALVARASFLYDCCRQTWNEEEAYSYLAAIAEYSAEVKKLAAAAAVAADAAAADLAEYARQISRTLGIADWSVRAMRAALKSKAA